MTRIRSLIASLSLTLMAGLWACGGGGSSSTPIIPPPTGTGSFSVGNYSMTLSVYEASSDSSGTVGTKTINLTRTSGFTSPVTLSTSALPSGIKVNFAQTSITGNSVEMTVEAGYPDPSDATFKNQIIPSPGTYNISIFGTAGSETATGTLQLTVDSNIRDFAVALITVNGVQMSLDTTTCITLRPGTDITKSIAAYVSDGTYTDQPITLSVEGLPAGLSATFDTNIVNLNESNHTITLGATVGIAPGTYSFRVKALHQNGQARYLPLVVTCSDVPFWIQPITTPSVVQGGTITFPVQLGRNDTFYQETAFDPPAYSYLDVTNVSAISVPSGISTSIVDTNPTAFATVPLTITTDSGLAPNTYQITLRATRGTAVQDLDLPITVTGNASSATYWVQRVEWGQTVLEQDLPLVPGKPALLRVHLLADRSGVTTPAISARIENGSGILLDTLPLGSPAVIPMATDEGDLSTTCNLLVPGADIQSGISVQIQADGSTLQTLLPNVEGTGYNFPLTVVPIVHKNLTPSLPSDADITSYLLAYWPLRGVSITHRAPYTTATVIPTPDPDASLDHSGDGWSQLLGELATLRMIDGSDDSYYGFFNLGLPISFTGNSNVGLHYSGIGAGIGIDAATAQRFRTHGELLTMVHELGHGFNVNHAPLGGAAEAMLNYPYEGSSIGSWGYDPSSSTIYDPASRYDIMGYTDQDQWTSDWSYMAALGFIREMTIGGTPIPLPARQSPAEQVLVSGWISPDGQVHLAPLVQATCIAAPPRPGELELTLTSDAGLQRISFKAESLADLPKGYRHFTFTVPAQGNLKSLEIRLGSKSMLRREMTSSAALISENLPAFVQEISMDGRTLHLRWDARQHPYVTVIHEGARRTTLALHLTGGSADLPLEDLPAGGRFLVHYSDGLNTQLHRTVERRTLEN